MLPQTRPVLHGAIAAALERLHAGQLDEVVDQLGHHYARAGNARKAIAYLIRFANRVALSYAMDDSLGALQHAMEVVTLLPAAERDDCVLDLVLRQAFAMSMQGRQREILALLRAHADRLHPGTDPLLVSEYQFRLGLTCFYLGNRAEAASAGGQALAAGERAGDDGAIGKALHVLSLCAFEAGTPREGIACAARAIPLLDRPQTQAWHALVHHDLALNCVMASRLAEALAAADREAAIGRAAKIPRLLALVAHVAAWALTLRGEPERR